MLRSHSPIELTRTHRLRTGEPYYHDYFANKDEIFLWENVIGSIHSHSFIHLLKTWKIVDKIMIWDDESEIILTLEQDWWSLRYGEKREEWWEHPYQIDNKWESWGFINIDHIWLPERHGSGSEDDLLYTHHSITSMVSRLLEKEEKLRDDINSAVELFHTEARKVLLSI